MTKLSVEGIIPPMVTPVKSNLKPDLAATQKLINHLIQGSVQGIFVLGTTGEGTNLSLDEKKEYLKAVCEFTDSRVPVYVGLMENAYHATIEMAEFAAGLGTEAAVLTIPSYFSLSEPDITIYLRKLAQELPLPVVLYDIPSYSRHKMSFFMIQELMNEPNVIGFKDSSGDLERFHLLIDQYNKPVLIGPEILLAEAMLMGAAGGVPGGANLFPKLFVDLFEACQHRDIGKLKLIQKHITMIREKLYLIPGGSYSYLKSIKICLKTMGIGNGKLIPPLQSVSRKESRIIEKNFEALQSELMDYA